MPTISAKIRKITGKKTETLRKEGLLPAVLYGPEAKSQAIKVDLREFKRIFKEAGESSLIDLKIGDETKKVLVHDTKIHPLTEEFIHVDFYEPLLKEKVTVTIPLVFIGEAPAERDLGGVLVKNISEVEVRALPQELPQDIKVNTESLKTFDDEILIKDLETKEGVKILREPDEVVAIVVPPRAEEKERVAEEVVPAEVEVVEKKKKEEEKEEEEEE